MVGLIGNLGHSSRRSSNAGNRNSMDESKMDGPEDETTIVEPDQGNVLSHIISQLRPGADLSRVVLPTFILEPKSMLERITNFMAHPETLLPMPSIEDPTQRFVSVVKFYLSGWHIKPPGVKKPLNPILGETFTGYWQFPDGTHGYYISEQTSHHPPKSSYFYMAPEHHIRIDGTLKPRSKFLGNSAASMMEGIAVLKFTNRGPGHDQEKYFLTQPNMYARGILFGKMKYELGDHSFVRCPKLGLSADIEFKTKGYFGGTYNAIGGVIKNDKTGDVLYELSGMWSGEMSIKNMKTGQKEVLFNATTSKQTPIKARPLEVQDERESQKLWYKTAEAVKARNHELATDEKTKIEDMQRDEAARRTEDGVEWQPRLFRKVRGGPNSPEEGEEDLEWILNADITGDSPSKQVQQILSITPILEKQDVQPPNTNTPQQQARHPQPTQASQPPAPAPAPAPASAQAQAQAPVPAQTQAPAPSQHQAVPTNQMPPNSTGQAHHVPTIQPQDLPPAGISSDEHLNFAGNNGHQRQAPPVQTSDSGTAQASQGPLSNFHQDMDKNLPPPTIKRQATSGDLDEFVDAKE